MLASKAHKLGVIARTKDIFVNEDITFEGLLLSEPTLAGLSECEFERPSPIQFKAIPFGKCGFDLIAQAKSGTGKTCMFGVIALEMLQLPSKSLQVLILAPTREIAVQVADVLAAIGQYHHDLNVVTLIGGLPEAEDRKRIKNCHIVVGTPGRVRKLVDEGSLDVSRVRLVVLDEADRLLDDSFVTDIRHLLSKLPDQRQTLASSATYTPELKLFIETFMRNPIRVNPDLTCQSEGAEGCVLLGVRQCAGLIPAHPNPLTKYQRKVQALIHVLSNVPFKQCLVFNNMHGQAQATSQMLTGRGWPTMFISGHMEQTKRLEAISALVDFRCRILLSTDLSARGLDAANVDLVVNMDIPKSEATYLHRVGRAGRFGTRGIVISIIENSGQELERLQNLAGITQITLGAFKIDPKVPLPLDLLNCQLATLNELFPREFKENLTEYETASEKSESAVKISESSVKISDSSVKISDSVDMKLSEPSSVCQNVQSDSENDKPVDLNTKVVIPEVELFTESENINNVTGPNGNTICQNRGERPEIKFEEETDLNMKELEEITKIIEESMKVKTNLTTTPAHDLSISESNIDTMISHLKKSSSPEKKHISKPQKPPRSKQENCKLPDIDETELNESDEDDKYMQFDGSFYSNISNVSIDLSQIDVSPIKSEESHILLSPSENSYPYQINVDSDKEHTCKPKLEQYFEDLSNINRENESTENHETDPSKTEETDQSKEMDTSEDLKNTKSDDVNNFVPKFRIPSSMFPIQNQVYRHKKNEIKEPVNVDPAVEFASLYLSSANPYTSQNVSIPTSTPEKKKPDNYSQAGTSKHTELFPPHKTDNYPANKPRTFSRTRQNHGRNRNQEKSSPNPHIQNYMQMKKPQKYLTLAENLNKMLEDINNYSLPPVNEVLGYDRLKQTCDMYVPIPKREFDLRHTSTRHNPYVRVSHFVLRAIHKINGDIVVATKNKFCQHGGTINYLKYLADENDSDEEMDPVQNIKNYDNFVTNPDSFYNISRSEWTLGIDDKPIDSDTDQRTKLQLPIKHPDVLPISSSSSDDEPQERRKPKLPKKTISPPDMLNILMHCDSENPVHVYPPVPTDLSEEALALWKQQVKLTTFMMHYNKYLEFMYAPK